MPVSQALALFVKLIRRIVKYLIDLRRSVVEDTVPANPSAIPLQDAAASQVENELKEAGKEVEKEMKERLERSRIMIGELDLSR